jgi:hypothetical protein
MIKTIKNSGYVGLLIMLIITVAIMALIMWKSGFFKVVGESVGTEKAAEQENLQAIQNARNLKDALEQKDRQNLQQ